MASTFGVEEHAVLHPTWKQTSVDAPHVGFVGDLPGCFSVCSGTLFGFLGRIHIYIHVHSYVLVHVHVRPYTYRLAD